MRLFTTEHGSWVVSFFLLSLNLGCGYLTTSRLEPANSLALTEGIVITNSALNSAALAVLQKRCVACHGSQSSGQGGMNYVTDLNQLVAQGMIVPQNSGSSKLFMRIASGSMPPGAPMPASETQTIKDWIDTGMAMQAVVPSPVTSASAGPTPNPAPSTPGPSPTPTPSTSSLFPSVQKIMQNNCASCHDYGNYNQNDWINSGLIVPGNITNSRLLQKLKNSGIAGPQNMPEGASPLSGGDISTIKTWIQSI